MFTGINVKKIGHIGNEMDTFSTSIGIDLKISQLQFNKLKGFYVLINFYDQTFNIFQS
jgi:hypothetical protein